MFPAEMSILIQTDTSHLTVQNFDDRNLLDNCVQEVLPNLVHRPPIRVFGKDTQQPRNVGFFSNISHGYKYSNQTMVAQQLTPSLSKLLDTVNKIFHANFNGILVNQYSSGADKIGEHSDDEKGLDPNVGVVAISWGAVRNFRIRCRATKEIRANIPTHPYQILQMGGNFQKEFTHEIPAEKKIKEQRISFTFRYHID
jgi:alkylated DNA repair dioxygenase AlkB